MWPPSPALLGTTTSYPEPIGIPSAQPGDSPTFCVPINAEWIPIVAGALQQLAQTNIWAGMTEIDALAAVGAAWDLIASVANATACTVFSLQFTMGCTLQYSTDGGTTWTDVPGWDSYFAACVGSSTGGGGGAPPPDVTVDGATLACNMAGYLIQTLLRQVIQTIADRIVASGFIEDALDVLVALIPGIDATMPLVIAATDSLFTTISGAIADFLPGALTNLIWSKIGCIIYMALDPFVGWTATVLSDLIAAITGATVAPSTVLNAIANYLNGLGVPALQSITAPAYLTTYSCSTCMAAGDPIDLTSAPTLAQIPNLIVTDGTTTIQPTGMITVVGATVSGTSPNATITVTEPPVPIPSFPAGTTTAEGACNIAGYITNELIVQAMLIIAGAFALPNTSVWAAAEVAQQYPGSGPVLASLVTACGNLYDNIQTNGSVGDYQAFAVYAPYLSALTCAISGALAADGYVTASNFTALCSAVGAVPASGADEIPPALAAYLTDLTDLGLATLSLPGAWAIYDCTACGSTGATGPTTPISPVTFLLSTTDGTTNVVPTQVLSFAGATVSQPTAGTALVTLPSGMVLLGEALIPDDTTDNVGFESIPPAFQHLRLYGMFACTNAGEGSGPAFLALRLNGDVSLTYQWEALENETGGSAPALTTGNAVAEMTLLEVEDEGASPVFALRMIIDIPYYADATFFLKTVTADCAGAGADAVIHGKWSSADAITSVAVQVATPFFFKSGTKMSLYGIS